MYCTVYLLRRQGKKVPPDEARKYPNEGWLYMGQHEKSYPQVDAILYRDQTKATVLLRLKFARVHKIDRGGMILFGHDSHVEHYQPQVWYAVVSTRPAPAPPPPQGRDWRRESLEKGTEDIMNMARAMGKMQ